jgi:hypothetical protein
MNNRTLRVTIGNTMSFTQKQRERGTTRRGDERDGDGQHMREDPRTDQNPGVCKHPEWLNGRTAAIDIQNSEIGKRIWIHYIS